MASSYPPTSPASSLGILFAEDFDDVRPKAAPAPEPEPEPEIVVPTFSVEEMEAARKEAYADGHRAASDLAATHLADAAARAMSKLEASLEQVRLDAAESTEKSLDALAKLVFSSLSSLLPVFCSQHAPTEIAGFARSIVSGMTPDMALRIHVAAPLVELVREAVADLSPDLIRRLNVAAAEGLPLGDAKLTWDSGVALRNASQTREDVRQIFAQFGLLEADAPPAPIERKSFAPASHTFVQAAKKVEPTNV